MAKRSPRPASVRFTRRLNLPPREVYRAFTHATALRDWLCSAAHADARPGGRLYLWWNSGYYAAGEFITTDPGKKIAFTWHGRGEPAFTRVQVTFAPQGEGGTRLTLVHSGMSASRTWANTVEEFTQGWEAALENLQFLLETGLDLRDMRRPRMGIFLDEFNPEIAAQLGVPVAHGVRVAGTMPDSGAARSGLQKDDVLVRLGGRALKDYHALGPALQGRQGGDSVPIVYYRGAEKKAAQLELSRWPRPHVPATAAELAQETGRAYARVQQEFARRLKGVSEAQAEARPAPGEWNAKELVAHFIACERDLQSWVADMLNDNVAGDSLEYRPNVTPRLQAIVQQHPSLAALRRELRRSMAETVSLLGALPLEFVARRHLFTRVARWVLETVPGHLFDQHSAQLQAVLEAQPKS